MARAYAPARQRPYVDEVGRDPGRLRIGWTARTVDGDLGHPDCVAAVEDAALLCASLGHDVAEADPLVITPEVSAAIGTLIHRRDRVGAALLDPPGRA